MSERNLIVAEFKNTKVIIDKKWFEFKELCSTYNSHGQQIDCHEAGCHSLKNFSSVATESFKQIVRVTFDIPESIDFSIESKINSEGVRFYYSEFDESTNISPETKDNINGFINSWEEENSRHYLIFAYTYNDGNHWKTVTLKPEQEDFNEISREEIEWVKNSTFNLERIADREEEKKIIEAFLEIEDDLKDGKAENKIESNNYTFYYSTYPSFFVLSSINDDPFDDEN